MTHPRWKTMDVPDVPDPGATQPPTRIDPDLLREEKATESLMPMTIGTPVAAPSREAPPIAMYLLIATLLVFGVGAMLSSGLLAGLVLAFS